MATHIGWADPEPTISQRMRARRSGFIFLTVYAAVVCFVIARVCGAL